MQKQTSNVIEKNATNCLNLIPAKITVDSNSKTRVKKNYSSDRKVSAKSKNNMESIGEGSDSNDMCSTTSLQVVKTNIDRSNSSLEGASNVNPRRNPKRKVTFDVKYTTAKIGDGHSMLNDILN